MKTGQRVIEIANLIKQFQMASSERHSLEFAKQSLVPGMLAAIKDGYKIRLLTLGTSRAGSWEYFIRSNYSDIGDSISIENIHTLDMTYYMMDMKLTEKSAAFIDPCVYELLVEEAVKVIERHEYF